MSGLDWSLFVYLHLFELRIFFACVEPVQVLELSASHGLLVLFEPMHMCIYIFTRVFMIYAQPLRWALDFLGEFPAIVCGPPKKTQTQIYWPATTDLHLQRKPKVDGGTPATLP